jgi:hypothetical protein
VAGPEDGTTHKDFSKGLRKFGFRANVKVVRDQSKFKDVFRWLTKQTENGKLVIAEINGNYSRFHWILVLRILPGGRVHCWDPNDELSKVVSKSNFRKACWNANHPQDPSPDPPERFLLVAMSPRSKLARRVVEIRRNLLFPPPGELPTDKDIPKSLEELKTWESP